MIAQLLVIYVLHSSGAFFFGVTFYWCEGKQRKFNLALFSKKMRKVNPNNYTGGVNIINAFRSQFKKKKK